MIIRHQNVLPRTMREINVRLPHAPGWSRTSLPVDINFAQHDVLLSQWLIYWLLYSLISLAEAVLWPALK